MAQQNNVHASHLLPKGLLFFCSSIFIQRIITCKTKTTWFLPPMNEVWGKVIFHSCLCPQGDLASQHVSQVTWPGGSASRGRSSASGEGGLHFGEERGLHPKGRKGVCVQGEGICIWGRGSASGGSAFWGGEGVCIQGGGTTTPTPKIHGILWYTVNKQAVPSAGFNGSLVVDDLK